MSMEKNGAISSNTPSGCCGGGCHQKQSSDRQMVFQFPKDAEQADAMEQDVTKQAVDAVVDETNGE
jgi:hypothetical protein